MSEPVIGLEAVAVRYGRALALERATGSFASGSLTALVGANGAGKSTLLKVVAGVLAPSAGRVVRRVPDREIAYLPQSAEIDRDFPITAGDFVLAGGWRRVGAFGGIPADLRRAAEAALAAVDMADLAQRGIGALSGGQFQRLLFARLILQDARVILLDEPFAALDGATVADLVDLIRAWHAAGRTVVAALHELDLVREVFPETLKLARAPLAWGPTAEVLRGAA